MQMLSKTWERAGLAVARVIIGILYAELAVSVLAALLCYIPADVVVARDDWPTLLHRLLLIIGFAAVR